VDRAVANSPRDPRGDDREETVLQTLVSLSAFPKSGVTYLSFLLFYSLFPDTCDVHELERRHIIDIHAYPRAIPPVTAGLRLFKSHFAYNPALPIVKATNKAIYLIRHPIDVMMSVWDFENLVKGGQRTTQSPEFRAFVARWIETGGAAFPEYGPWTGHVRSWLAQSQIPVHLVTYRNLVDRPVQEIEAIFSFLGTQVDTDRLRLAAERSSMKAMAALEQQEVEKKIEGVFFNKNLTAGYGLGHRFINKGYRSSYETILTAEERARADRTFGTELTRFFAEPSFAKPI
jgi:Sulfotransferase domain